MDNVSSPNITFDEKNICNYCHAYDENVKLYGYKGEESRKELKKLVKKMKKDGKGKEYDCVLGISGGVDSAYMAYIASRLGLRILAVHVDAGWNSEIAVDNIKKMCNKLNLDLHTIVVDWPSMKELQRAYMFSGLANLDVPQDHAFIAGVYEFARKNHIKYILNGSNLATEGILPENFGHANIDFRHIKSVYKSKGRGKKIFNKYPHLSLPYYLYMKRSIVQVKLLNYVPYSQKKAIDVLKKEFDWNYYGGKHFESRFTKFFQSYYLPHKYGYDKRRAHLSSLVVSGELTREEALSMMADTSIYPEEEMLDDKDYIIKKLDISQEEWESIMSSSVVSDSAYKGNTKILNRLVKLKHLFLMKQATVL